MLFVFCRTAVSICCLYFVVQLYLYVVCILSYSCIYVLFVFCCTAVSICCLYFVYLYIGVFFYLCHLHIPGSFYIYIYQSQSELCIALYISCMVFLFYLSVLLYLTLLFCNLYFIKCPFVNMVFHADLCLFFTLLYACLACL